jgi:hypothetical protein
MNITEKHLAKFKQELIPIACLSIIQVWWSFKYPVYIRLGTPWSIIVTILVSIIGIMNAVYTFSHIEELSPLFFNLKALDGMPYESIFKKISVIWSISVVVIVFLRMVFA